MATKKEDPTVAALGTIAKQRAAFAKQAEERGDKEAAARARKEAERYNKSYEKRLAEARKKNGG